jgi:8-oxo-dGTP pyrophosphatase MutT (NUDIX family)
VNRFTLVAALARYTTPFPAEQAFIARFQALLAHPDCYLRTHLPGHLTGSAWITNRSRDRVLLVKHAKLDKWLQPGGHADGNENMVEVALREVQEETGLDQSVVAPGLFDIDIHTIPARKDFPAHEHYDVRFLLEADETRPLTINHESTALQWVALHELTHYNRDASLQCMAAKLLRGN